MPSTVTLAEMSSISGSTADAAAGVLAESPCCWNASCQSISSSSSSSPSSESPAVVFRLFTAGTSSNSSLSASLSEDSSSSFRPSRNFFAFSDDPCFFPSSSAASNRVFFSCFCVGFRLATAFFFAGGLFCAGDSERSRFVETKGGMLSLRVA